MNATRIRLAVLSLLIAASPPAFGNSWVAGVGQVDGSGNLIVTIGGVAQPIITGPVTFVAGQAGAGLAPIYFTAGTNLGAAEAGALEYDGTNLFLTDAAVARHSLVYADVPALTGDLSVATNKFTVAAASGNTLVAGTLNVTGNVAVNTNKFNVTAASGNTAIAGDLAIATNKFTVAAASGNTLAAGTLSATGDFKVNTDKFVVTAASGNTAVAGTLGVTGDVAVNTDKFTVAASSGNTVIAGTLNVTGAITGNVTGNVSGTAGGLSGFSGVKVAVPAAKTDACTAGQYALEAGFAYFCVSSGGWQRVAIADWP